MTKSAAELFDLTGKVALVAGGSRGMGREMVLAFARAGADVVIASRRLESCEQLAREVEAGTGRRALAHACHVGRWGELDGLADAAYATFGKVDVLVNNAGMSPVYDRVADVTEELYDKVLAVNLKGPFRLTALVGTRMAAGDGGSIINVSSVGAIRPYGGIVPYAAAKAGVNAMTVAFAHALGPKVRVNCIMPGSFLTDLTRGWDMDEFEAKQAPRFALRRAGQPVRNRRRRAVSGERGVELHDGRDPAGRRRRAVVRIRAPAPAASCAAIRAPSWVRGGRSRRGCSTTYRSPSRARSGSGRSTWP